MHLLRPLIALTLTAALVATGAGCTREKPPKESPTTPAGQTSKPKARPELTAPFEAALTALQQMNAAAKQKDLAGVKGQVQAFRSSWATVKKELDPLDAKLAKHIEDGAVELDIEVAKPLETVRWYEFDEEAVKLGRLLSKAAEMLGAPIRADLVQKDPTTDIPFNSTRRIDVTLIDHKIQPEVIEVEQHTKVTFVVTNKGKEIHEFALEHYAVEVEDLKPGETKELTLVVLDAGEFETACHIPGHYEVGMFGKLKVKPAELKR